MTFLSYRCVPVLMSFMLEACALRSHNIFSWGVWRGTALRLLHNSFPCHSTCDYPPSHPGPSPGPSPQLLLKYVTACCGVAGNPATHSVSPASWRQFRRALLRLWPYRMWLQARAAYRIRRTRLRILDISGTVSCQPQATYLFIK